MWLDHAEYYATIRLGDVDGDGHDDVVARGPYGIRTWFYNRPGQPGWGRYLPDGYPDFPNPTCDQGVTTPCGQQAAFAALNNAAVYQGLIASGGTLRDVWAAKTVDLKTLPGQLPGLSLDVQGSGVGNCPAANKTHDEPPTYSSCIPPAPPAGGSNAFNGAGWTEVVNEILSEIYLAEQVGNHFTDIETMRAGLFESATNSLPAIGNDLQIAGADNNPASFNLQGFFAGATGIAASIAGAFPGGTEASAGLWVASELISMLPSASQTATSSFQTTYDGLTDKIATAQDEMADAWTSQQRQVLGDQGLLRLVGQLRSQGTWIPDTDGMRSASRQSFVLETYQALLPTMYQRYAVTNCTTQVYPGETVNCDLPTGPLVVGGGASATWVGPSLSSDPCPLHQANLVICNYPQNPGMVPASVANIVWGAVSDTCNYQPGNANTLWHFGCSLGVPVATSIGADSPGWTFTTKTGDPIVVYLGSVRAPVSATPGVVRAGAARDGSGARAAQAGSSALRPRHLLAPLRFNGRVRLSRALRLRRMRVAVERTLFEHGRREQLARSRSGRRLRLFALRHVRGGRFTSHRRGRPRVRLHIRRLDARGGARLDLRLTRVRTRDIRALCTVLPASVSLAGRPLELETRLRLRDRGLSRRITMRQRWRCVRDRKGEFTGIRPIKPRRPAARPGLAVRLGAPRVLASGRRATVRVTVANQRRRRSDRVASSLWDLRITGGAGSTPRTIRFKELRAGRSRTVRLTVPVPRAARGRVCVRVAAGAASARGASARRCARVASRPRADCSAAANPPAQAQSSDNPLRVPDHLRRRRDRSDAREQNFASAYHG